MIQEIQCRSLQLGPLVHQHSVSMLPSRPRRHELVVEHEAGRRGDLGLHVQELSVAFLPGIPGRDNLVVQEILRSAGQLLTLRNAICMAVLPGCKGHRSLTVQQVARSFLQMLPPALEFLACGPPLCPRGGNRSSAPPSRSLLEHVLFLNAPRRVLFPGPEGGR